jgi:hypothetical protein
MVEVSHLVALLKHVSLMRLRSSGIRAARYPSDPSSFNTSLRHSLIFTGVSSA